MKTVTFECETVTPMFLAGADGRTPELRPPSIKGLMRFWWRAMNGHLPLGELKREESEIFGASDEKIGRSKFNIRVNEQPTSEDIIESLWEEIPYEKRTSKTGKYAGTSYLLYSTHMLNDRPYIRSNTPFSVEISSGDDNILREVVHSFAFLTFFGALGTRNRRGAGSFAVKDLIHNGGNNYRKLFYTSEIQSKDQLKNHIESELKPLLGNTGNRSYSTLKSSKICILDSENNWKDALESIGRPFLDFRDKNQKRISDTPNFGFPILHNHPKSHPKSHPKRLMGAGPESPKKNSEGNVVDFIERRASPLVFKVIKTNKDNYFSVIICLNGELTQFGYKIMDKKGGNIKAPGEGIITEFLNTIHDRLEVTL